MARTKTKRQLKYSAYPRVKVLPETDIKLAQAADQQGIKKGTLIRKIIEQWLEEREQSNVYAKNDSQA